MPCLIPAKAEADAYYPQAKPAPMKVPVTAQLGTQETLQPGVPGGELHQPSVDVTQHTCPLAQQAILAARSGQMVTDLFTGHLPGQVNGDLLATGDGGDPVLHLVLQLGGANLAQPSNVSHGEEGENLMELLFG